MAKRPASDTAGDRLSGSASHNKRRQTSDEKRSENATPASANISALYGLLENADELIDCLQQLKRSKKSIAETDSNDEGLIATQVRLAAISPTVLPHLQTLGENSDTTQQGRSIAKSSEYAPSQDGSVTSPLVVDALQSSDVSRTLPPLPPVKDPKLEAAAFTHKGSDPFNHYERLEWVGDAYLELIATLFLDKTFAKLSSGRLSQMRERLIRNTQLAEYFREYKMHSRAKLPTDLAARTDLGRGSSRDKDLLKTQGDMFEAYVAAVILSDTVHGLGTAVRWLKALWARTLQDDIKKNESDKGDAPNHSGHDTKRPTTKTPKEELAALIVVKGILIRYETMECSKKDKHHNLPLFAVGAYLDGWGETHRLLGIGTALNVKEAGQKAASAAIQNKKLLSQYEAKKASFLAARAAGEAGQNQ
ncbi:hypothetical protein K4F52_002542 [Lecanicillium sp. MT-2017a]|nr:hypothetical protein K4F52_002542 [Lecanicillium sp. MT-2017a]